MSQYSPKITTTRSIQLRNTQRTLREHLENSLGSGNTQKTLREHSDNTRSLRESSENTQRTEPGQKYPENIDTENTQRKPREHADNTFRTLKTFKEHSEHSENARRAARENSENNQRSILSEIYSVRDLFCLSWPFINHHKKGCFEALVCPKPPLVLHKDC